MTKEEIRDKITTGIARMKLTGEDTININIDGNHFVLISELSGELRGSVWGGIAIDQKITECAFSVLCDLGMFPNDRYLYE